MRRSRVAAADSSRSLDLGTRRTACSVPRRRRRAPRPMPSTASAASCVGERLGRRARHARRRPRSRGRRRPLRPAAEPCAVGDRDGAAHRSRAPRPSVSTISSVRPDCDSATASTPDRSSRAAVHGGDRRRREAWRAGRPADLDQVAAVDGGVVRGPAGDEQHLAGAVVPSGGDLAGPRQQRVEGRRAAPAGCCVDLRPHLGHRRRRGHRVTTLSSLFGGPGRSWPVLAGPGRSRSWPV